MAADTISRWADWVSAVSELSKIDAVGEVYHLVNASDFFATYVSGRVGWAAGEAGRGEMWLKNTKGVLLHLKARRGLMLSMGADTIQISPR